MANVSDIRGAVVIGTFNDSVKPRISTYVALSGNATNIFPGDIVKLAGNTDSLGKYQAIAPLSGSTNDTSVPLGIVVGVDPIKGVTVGSENLNRTYRPASTQMYVYVCDDPNVEFWLQDDGASGSTIATSALGQNSSINSNVAGSTATMLSGHQISAANVGTGNTLPVKILGLMDRVDNVLGQYQKLRCMFNTHQHKVATGATGV